MRIWQSFKDINYNTSRQRDCRPPSLYHANLYAFAVEKLIEPLQTRCLHHLHRELINFNLNQDNSQEVLQLLHFAYNRGTRRSFCGEDRLKKPVIHYTACHLEILAL